MYFRLTDESLRNGKARSVEISVEYFDEGSGRVVLQYDSLEETQAGRAKSLVLATLSGAKTWKTATVAIPDARFGGRCGAADFRFAMPKEVNFTVAAVEVVKR